MSRSPELIPTPLLKTLPDLLIPGDHQTQIALWGVEGDGGGAVVCGIEIRESDAIGRPVVEVGAGFDGVGDAGGGGVEGDGQGVGAQGRGGETAAEVLVGI